MDGRKQSLNFHYGEFSIEILGNFHLTKTDCIYVLTTLPRLFIFIQLPGTHLIDSSTFSCNAQYHSFWLQHLQAVWNLHLNTDFERSTLISYKAWFIAFILPPFVAISSSGHTLTLTYQKMHREDDDYCDLIYECLYEEGVALSDELSDEEFKKLIRKQYNYIRKIVKEGFY